MRVVSLVPSWTETLIEAGVEVVGRTRFCIHPSEKIKNIPVVGGTKDCKWEKVKELKPNLVLFDEEENLKEMSEQCPFPWISTHVTGIQDMGRELKKLSEELSNKKLLEYSRRWEKIVASPEKKGRLQGVLEWLRMPAKGSSPPIAYIIWKNPWMAAGEDTFIGSIFNHLGFENHFTQEKYPKFKMDEVPSDVLLLFSSEPYPFGKKRPEIGDHPAAIVDGEKYGWFGVRSLLFLETLNGTTA